jgi:hypothetical protein
MAELRGRRTDATKTSATNPAICLTLNLIRRFELAESPVPGGPIQARASGKPHQQSGHGKGNLHANYLDEITDALLIVKLHPELLLASLESRRNQERAVELGLVAVGRVARADPGTADMPAKCQVRKD